MKTWSLVFLICLSVSACALNPLANRPSTEELLFPSYEDLLPDGRVSATTPIDSGSEPVAGDMSLQATLSSLGVQLSSQEWTQLRFLTEVKPNGHWSRSSDRSAEQNLLANFRRFAPLFNPPIQTAEEYRTRAVAFAEKEKVDYYLDFRYYTSNNRLLVVKWDIDSGEFLVIQSDGTLVNYLITQDIEPPRYLKVTF